MKFSVLRSTLLTFLVAACSSSSSSPSDPVDTPAGNGQATKDPATDTGDEPKVVAPKSAPAIQCPKAPCPGVSWARVSDAGASPAWGVHGLIAGGARFALVGAQSQAKLRASDAAGDLALDSDSATLLILGSDGATSKRIDLANVSPVGGLTAAKDGRLALVVGRGSFAKPTTVAGKEVPATDTANVVVVLDADGSVAWSAPLGGTYVDTTLAFTADGGLVFGGTKNNGLNSTRPTLRKWSAGGNDAWQSTMDAAPNTRVTVTGVAVSKSGSLFVVGFHSGELKSVPISEDPSSFLLQVSPANGDVEWAKNLGDFTESPSLAVVDDDAVVASNGVARYAGGTSAPSAAVWTVALPTDVTVQALSADGARIAVLGSLRAPTQFSFGTLGTATSSVSKAAAGLFVLDLGAQGTIEGGFSINPDPSDSRAARMKALSISTSGDRVVVSGTFASSIDLGFGPVQIDGGGSGQLVVELARP